MKTAVQINECRIKISEWKNKKQIGIWNKENQ